MPTRTDMTPSEDLLHVLRRIPIGRLISLVLDECGMEHERKPGRPFSTCVASTDFVSESQLSVWASAQIS
jgi:hypothetical protein